MGPIAAPPPNDASEEAQGRIPSCGIPREPLPTGLPCRLGRGEGEARAQLALPAHPPVKTAMDRSSPTQSFTPLLNPEEIVPKSNPSGAYFSA